MSAQPPVPAPPGPPVHWYQSQKFKAYVGSWLSLVLGWALQCMSNNVWEWKALAASTLGLLVLVVNDWRGPHVIAPIPMLNRGNAARPTP